MNSCQNVSADMNTFVNDVKTIAAGLKALGSNWHKYISNVLNNAGEVLGDVESGVSAGKSGDFKTLGQSVGDLSKVIFLN